MVQNRLKEMQRLAIGYAVNEWLDQGAANHVLYLINLEYRMMR